MADKRLSDILISYDTFILDSSVVSSSPRDEFYPGAEAMLSFLAEQGKQVIFFDNSPLFPAAHFSNIHWRKWSDNGFGFCTSFGLCQSYLQQQGYFSYFLLGNRPLPGMIFAPDMSMAEFIYLDLPGLPQTYFKPDDKNIIKVPEIPDLVFASSVEAFAPFLRQAREQEKMIYCGRPSLSDKMLIGSQEVVSNKAVLDCYRSLGGQVMDFGKPNLTPYKYIFSRLPEVGRILCLSRNSVADSQGSSNLRRAGYQAESLFVDDKDLSSFIFK